jgi:hypothetical protein
MVFGLFVVITGMQAREQIDITQERLRQDESVLKTYVTQTVAADIKEAKKAGKMMAHIAAGISNYAYDSIPWLFFDDEKGMDEIFNRLCDDASVRYIQEGKEEYKKNIQRSKPRISKSKLGEFLHRRAINAMSISDDQKKILNDEPAKTDEFVGQGTVNKSEYMYYNLLNLIIQYYLEKEHGKHRE